MTYKGPLWSERQGRGPRVLFDHDEVRRVFASTVSEFEVRGWFQEWFGYVCVDSGHVPGRLGEDVQAALLIEVGRLDVWPVRTNAGSWTDDALFDMVEFLFRCISAGIKETGRFHSFSGCGWHFSQFDQAEGQAAYRDRINMILARYGDGFELTDKGLVERHLHQQIADLAISPAKIERSDEEHVAEAIRKYRSRAGLDRRDAIRDLADVLERLRPSLKDHLFSKDESAMFQIANQFWIRHNRPDQRRDYNHDAWWDWIFHLYLSSIRLVQRLETDSKSVEVK